MLKVLSSSLFLLILTACGAPPQDGVEPGNPDAGIEVDGEGETAEGEGDTAEGEGDTAEGEGEEGEGETGEGEGEGEGQLVGDLYTGDAEDGVVCGGVTCASGAPCCLDLVGGATECSDNGTCMGSLTVVPLACDGPEDCTDPALPDCCASFGGASCVADGACAGGFNFETCYDDTSCNAGSNCCGSSQLEMVGIDAGVCVAPNADGDLCVIQGA
jgi:hypothetical protein